MSGPSFTQTVRVKPLDSDVEQLAGARNGAALPPGIAYVAPPAQDAPLSLDDQEKVRIMMLAMEKVITELVKKDAAPKRSRAAPPAGAGACARLWFRFLRCNLMKLVKGEDLSAEDADTAVNTLTLVCALILTIPFSVMGSIGRDFWENSAATALTCPQASRAPDFMRHSLTQALTTMHAMTYSSIGAIVLAVGYYLLRPKADDVFQDWWSRGRFPVIFILCLTATAVVATMTLYGQLVAYQLLVGFNSDLCAALVPFPNNASTSMMRQYITTMCTGPGLLGLLCLTSTLLML